LGQKNVFDSLIQQYCLANMHVHVMGERLKKLSAQSEEADDEHTWSKFRELVSFATLARSLEALLRYLNHPPQVGSVCVYLTDTLIVELTETQPAQEQQEAELQINHVATPNARKLN
jgi:hypothetical protein